jgi:hypothetical protein
MLLANTSNESPAVSTAAPAAVYVQAVASAASVSSAVRTATHAVLPVSAVTAAHASKSASPSVSVGTVEEHVGLDVTAVRT